MKTNLIKITLALCPFMLSACNNAEISELRSKVDTQNVEIAALKVKLETQETKIAGLELNDTIQSLDGVVYMTNANGGYQVVKSNVGVLAVSLENIQPYANGSKIIMSFGNLTSAKITGVSAKIEWGPVDDKGMPIDSPNRSRRIKLSEEMLSGRWTFTSAVLEGIQPADVGFVRLSEIKNTGLTLY